MLLHSTMDTGEQCQQQNTTTLLTICTQHYTFCTHPSCPSWCHKMACKNLLSIRQCGKSFPLATLTPPEQRTQKTRGIGAKTHTKSYPPNQITPLWLATSNSVSSFYPPPNPPSLRTVCTATSVHIAPRQQPQQARKTTTKKEEEEIFFASNQPFLRSSSL